MLKSKELYEDICSKLSIARYYLEMQNISGYFDINKYCEDFFGGLLNIVYDINLSNLNNIQYNYPAVDLGDSIRKICIQVTSTNDRSKIENTIKKFEGHMLYNKYTYLWIFILGDMKGYKSEFQYDSSKYILSIKDINILGKDISKLSLDKLKQVSTYLNSTLNISQCNEDKKLFEEFNLNEKNFMIFISKHDFSIEPTDLTIIDYIDKVLDNWGIGDKKFVNKNFNENISKIIESLTIIKSYLESPCYFRQHTKNTIYPIKSPSRKEFVELKEKTNECRKIICNSYNNMIQVYNQLYR